MEGGVGHGKMWFAYTDRRVNLPTASLGRIYHVGSDFSVCLISAPSVHFKMRSGCKCWNFSAWRRQDMGGHLRLDLTWQRCVWRDWRAVWPPSRGLFPGYWRFYRLMSTHVLSRRLRPMESRPYMIKQHRDPAVYGHWVHTHVWILLCSLFGS